MSGVHSELLSLTLVKRNKARDASFLRAQASRASADRLGLLKLGLSKDSPNEEMIPCILQMLYRARKHKGLNVPIENICYFDVRAGKIYVEQVADGEFTKKIGPKVAALAKAWEIAA